MNDVMAKSDMDEIVQGGTMEFDGPSGFEGVDQDCTIIPFLKIAQPGTEEAKKGSSKQIKGLEAGNFFCPSTGKVYGDSVALVILRFYRQYIVYESREADAKFLTTILPEQFKMIEKSCTRERSYYLDADGHRYVDTRNFVVFVHGHYEDGPMLLSMASTGIKPSQKLMTQATGIRAPDGRQAPIWSSVWSLTTGYFDNPLGGYYQVGQVSRLGWVPKARTPMIVQSFLDANAMATGDLDQSFGKEPAPEHDAERNVTGEAESQADIVSQAFAGKPKQGPAARENDNQPDIF